MKRMLLAMLWAAAPAMAAEGSINAAERAYLLEQLESSKKAMLASIQGVSAAQWAFKPAPTVWSVKECAEHIILAEDFLLGTVQQILKSPEVARPAGSNEQVDHVIVTRVQDRSQKATAPEAIVPSGKYATPEDAAREFTARRDKTIAYVKSTDDPLRVHVAPSPGGQMDAYQFLLLLASHSARHTAQIREVQSNAAYPRAGTKGE
jgi:hypothetical protein